MQMKERYVDGHTDSICDDSVNKIYTEQPIKTGKGRVAKDNAFPYVVFGVPIAFVIIVAVLKHVIWRIPNEREAAKFFLEISIDVLTVGATILFANYYKVSIANMFWLSIFLIVSMIISIIIRSLNLDGKLNGKKGLWIVVSPAMCVAAIIWLFFLVC